MSWLSRLSGRAKSGAAAASVAGKAEALPPPRIIVDRHVYQPEDFGLGSFRIRPYEGDLIARQQFDFRIAFKLDEDNVEFGCRGMVMKLDGESGLIARFQKPQPFYERKLLLYLRKWKGV